MGPFVTKFELFHKFCAVNSCDAASHRPVISLRLLVFFVDSVAAGLVQTSDRTPLPRAKVASFSGIEEPEPLLLPDEYPLPEGY
jgi:hypothetical protein